MHLPSLPHEDIVAGLSIPPEMGIPLEGKWQVVIYKTHLNLCYYICGQKMKYRRIKIGTILLSLAKTEIATHWKPTSDPSISAWFNRIWKSFILSNILSCQKFYLVKSFILFNILLHTNPSYRSKLEITWFHVLEYMAEKHIISSKYKDPSLLTFWHAHSKFHTHCCMIWSPPQDLDINLFPQAIRTVHNESILTTKKLDVLIAFNICIGNSWMKKEERSLVIICTYYSWYHIVLLCFFHKIILVCHSLKKTKIKFNRKK